MWQYGWAQPSRWELACSGRFPAVVAVAGATGPRDMAMSVPPEVISTIVWPVRCHQLADSRTDSLAINSRTPIIWGLLGRKGRRLMNPSDTFRWLDGRLWRRDAFDNLAA